MVTRRVYTVVMANELDDITASVECPACEGPLSVTYKTLRLGLTIECPACGETVRLIDDSPIGKIQRLIDDHGTRPGDIQSSSVPDKS